MNISEAMKRAGEEGHVKRKRLSRVCVVPKPGGYIILDESDIKADDWEVIAKKEETMCKTKFEVGKTYRTRDGRDARVICVDRKSEHYPIIALIEQGGGKEWENYTEFTAEGLFSEHGPSKHDLMPPMRTVWVNFYESDSKGVYSGVYSSKDGAERASKVDQIATAIPVEIPE